MVPNTRNLIAPPIPPTFWRFYFQMHLPSMTTIYTCRESQRINEIFKIYKATEDAHQCVHQVWRKQTEQSVFQKMVRNHQFEPFFGNQRIIFQPPEGQNWAYFNKNVIIYETHLTSAYTKFYVDWVISVWDEGQKPQFSVILFFVIRVLKLGHRGPKSNHFWRLIQ